VCRVRRRDQRGRPLAALALLLAAGLARAAAEGLPLPVGLGALQQIEWLPLLPPSGTQTRQFSSYDPSSGNDDGLFDRTWPRERTANGEVVFFDEYGPGCLYRQQMNVWQSGLDPARSRILYYFDGEPAPRIALTLDAFWGRRGFTAPWLPPLQYFDDLPKNPHHPNAFDRMGVSYAPLPFQKRLRIALAPERKTPGGPPVNGAWFQYTYQVLPANQPAASWTSGADARAVAAQWARLGEDPRPAAAAVAVSNAVHLAAGQAATLLDLSGAGSLAALHLTVQPFNADTFYNTFVRIYWDDAAEPAVDLPLGCLCGGGGGDFPARDPVWNRNLKTLLHGYSRTNGTLYSYWPMPYWKSARIAAAYQGGAGDGVRLALQAAVVPAAARPYPRERTGYFHAQRRLDAQAAHHGAFVRAFSEQGYGKLVALMFFTDRWSCDGDEFTWLDGSRTPQIHGDGSEDDHNGAWGSDRYAQPLWGSFTRYGDVPGVQQDYRLYLADSYVFHRDINVCYECSRLGDRRHARTESIVFYYRLGGAVCNLRATDALDVGNAASEAQHQYTVQGVTWEGTLTSAYDGFEQQRDFHAATDDGRAFTGACSFVVSVDPDNDGVRLRRRADRRQNGVQAARVSVDGRLVTERPWLLCDLSDVPADQRWRDSDFDIPAKYTRGKRTVRLTLEALPGPDPARGFSEFHYWLYSFGRAPLPAAARPATEGSPP